MIRKLYGITREAIMQNSAWKWNLRPEKPEVFDRRKWKWDSGIGSCSDRGFLL